MGAGFLPSLGPPDAGARFVGVQQSKVVAAPAAGSDWSYKIGGGVWERIALVSGLLTASAVVANRIPRLDILDPDGLILWRTEPPASLTANQSKTFCAAAGLAFGQSTGNTSVNLAFPSLWLPAGYQVRVVTSGIDVGDQWSAVRVLVEELDRGPLGENIGTDSTGY